MIIRFVFSAFLITVTLAQAQVPQKKEPPRTTPVVEGEKAVLRITCEGDSTGAEVSVNDQIKGQCPIDMEIPVGELRIRAVKATGPDRERVFEKEMRLGSGVVQKIEVALGWYQTTAEAIKRWERAADAGDAEAMYQLGWAYEWGTADVVDFAKSSAYYGRAANAGHPGGMYAFSAAITQERAATKDQATASLWFDKAFALGVGGALLSQAIRYELSGKPLLEKQSGELYARAAEAGEWAAMLEVRRSEPDPTKIQRLNRQIAQTQLRLAEAGKWSEMSIVSGQYLRGDGGFAKNPAKALALSRATFIYAEKAAAKGDRFGLEKLGYYYMRGSDWNSKDKAMAERLFREAAAKGSYGAKIGLEALLKE